MRAVLAVAIGVVIAVGGAVIALDQQNRLVWDHFDEVKPGVLYRSGQLELDQLEVALRRYGIKTLVNFQHPGKPVDAEGEVAAKLGVTYWNLPMPGDGSGREDQFRRVVEACSNPETRPVWVHCARGTCRTGAAVALYRFERDGWTVEDVADEMRRQAYRWGWLPGYVYAMVKERPLNERFQPPDRIGTNTPETAPPRR